MDLGTEVRVCRLYITQSTVSFKSQSSNHTLQSDMLLLHCCHLRVKHTVHGVIRISILKSHTAVRHVTTVPLSSVCQLNDKHTVHGVIRISILKSHTAVRHVTTVPLSSACQLKHTVHGVIRISIL